MRAREMLRCMLLRRLSLVGALLLVVPSLRAADPSSPAPAPADDPRVASALELARACLDAERAYEGVPGVSAAIVHDQKVLWSGAFGVADVASGRKAESGDDLQHLLDLEALHERRGDAAARRGQAAPRRRRALEAPVVHDDAGRDRRDGDHGRRPPHARGRACRARRTSRTGPVPRSRSRPTTRSWRGSRASRRSTRPRRTSSIRTSASRSPARSCRPSRACRMPTTSRRTSSRP